MFIDILRVQINKLPTNLKYLSWAMDSNLDHTYVWRRYPKTRIMVIMPIKNCNLYTYLTKHTWHWIMIMHMMFLQWLNPTPKNMTWNIAKRGPCAVYPMSLKSVGGVYRPK